MSDLLSRYAECLYWFGRYTERTACLARILEVQTSFTGGQPVEDADWGWLLTLYDDHAAFADLYNTMNAASVSRFYVADARNGGSLFSCIRAARENARTLRAMISTDLWMQVNAFYNRFRNLHAASFSPAQLSATCGMVKKECYAQLGVAEATLYRDAVWRFFMIGVMVERADQMSRLLDVRFAKMRQATLDQDDPLGDFALWSVLLRSAAAHQVYLRTEGGRRDPEVVARFFIFDTGLPRSLAYCTDQLGQLTGELRTKLHLEGTAPALVELAALQDQLSDAATNPSLINELHAFNDQIQSRLMHFSNALAGAFFGEEPPETLAKPPPRRPAQEQTQSGQSQTSG